MTTPQSNAKLEPAANAAPGSPYALTHGCTCPRLDNANGAGAYGGAAKGQDGQPLFWITAGCPLHGGTSDRL